MKICIFGAGAIGAFMGVMLERAGCEVSMIARGAHLHTMRQNGVRLLMENNEHHARPFCTDDPSELGPQDYVIITLKAHSIPAVVDRIRPLLGPNTAVVTAINGIPYWYFYQSGNQWDGTTLESIDPGGVQWTGLGPERAIGCVVNPATEVIEPGVIKHIYGDKFPIGEPSGNRTDRIVRLAQAMETAGLKAPIRDNIRDEIWLKLWGNLCFNPISALTGATLDKIAHDPETRTLARTMMMEAKAIGDRLGVHFRVDVERRIDGAGAVVGHKTSMLQDLERGRPMEIDALVTVVQELGELVGVATPTINTVLALVRQRAEGAGLYERPVSLASASTSSTKATAATQPAMAK